MARVGWGWVVAALLAASARAEDPPAEKPRHEYKTAPAAQAAIERYKRLVYRPEDHGLKSVKGSLVCVGFRSHARPTFEFVPPGELKSVVPPELEKEMDGANVVDGVIRTPLLAGLYVSDFVDFDRCDKELVEREGKTLLLFTDFDGDRPTHKQEFTLDADGLVAQWRSRPDEAPSAHGFTTTYSWMRFGDLSCVAGIDAVLENERPSSYACTISYADVNGVHLPVSWSMTYVSDLKTSRRLTFYVDDLVVNGEKVDLPKPWLHENKVTPEAQAALDRFKALVDKPADHGVTSATFDLVVGSGADAPRASYEFSAPGKVKPVSSTGSRSGPADPAMQALALSAAFSGLPIDEDGQRDAEIVSQGGGAALVLTTYRDGAMAASVECPLNADGLPSAITYRDDPDSGGSPAFSIRLEWGLVDGRWRVERAEATPKVEGKSARISMTFHYGDVAGVQLLESYDMLVSSVATGDVHAIVRVENLAVNGAPASFVGRARHENHVTDAAKAAIERFASLVYRPADHGFARIRGDLVTGGEPPRRHRFSVFGPLAVVELANGIAAESGPGRVATSELRTPLLCAYATTGLVGGQEYDADVVQEDGRNIVRGECFREGVRTTSMEIVLDATGLAASARVTTFKETGEAESATDTKYAWEKTGDKWRVAGVETVVYAPADLTKPLRRNAYALRYVEVDGMQLLGSFSVAEAVPGKSGSIFTLHVDNAFLNDKPVDVPRPVHKNVVTPDAAAAIERFEKLVYRPAAHGLSAASGVFQPLGLTFEVKPPARLTMPLPPGEKIDKARAGIQTGLALPLGFAFGALTSAGSTEFDATFEDRPDGRVLVVTDYRNDLPITTREVSIDDAGLIASIKATDVGPSGAVGSMRFKWADSDEGRVLASCETWNAATADAPHMTVSFTYSKLADVRVPTGLVMSFVGGVADKKSLRFGISEITVNGRKFIAGPKPQAPTSPAPTPPPATDGGK